MRENTVRYHMTPIPLTVTVNDPIAKAHRVMRDFSIRHLPVLENDRLAGVVSERDLYFMETLDREATSVREAMTADVYAVPPTATLEEVVREMARGRYGSAVVVERGRVVGMFTTVDALYALADVLARSSRSHGEAAVGATPVQPPENRAG